MTRLFEEIRKYHFEQCGESWDENNPKESWASLEANAEFFLEEGFAGEEFTGEEKQKLLVEFKEYYRHFAYIPA